MQEVARDIFSLLALDCALPVGDKNAVVLGCSSPDGAIESVVFVSNGMRGHQDNIGVGTENCAELGDFLAGFKACQVPVVGIELENQIGWLSTGGDVFAQQSGAGGISGDIARETLAALDVYENVAKGFLDFLLHIVVTGVGVADIPDIVAVGNGFGVYHCGIDWL